MGGFQDADGLMLQFCKAWENEDFDCALALIHEDILYSMFIPQDVVPFGGETRGRAAMADRMRTILTLFEMVHFQPIFFKTDGQVEHTRVNYGFRHRKTGELISGVMRLVATVEHGLISDLKEFHDLEKVRAFMRLISHTAGEN